MNTDFEHTDSRVGFVLHYRTFSMFSNTPSVSTYGRAAVRALCATLIGVMVAVAGPTSPVGSDFDRSANFSAYHSFAWMPKPPHRKEMETLLVRRIRGAIQAVLEHRGYVYAGNATAADFIVDLTLGAGTRADVRSYPAPYAGPWAASSGPWWGDPYWGSALDVQQHRAGTLSIDVFDARSHKPVWHGWAKEELTQADTDGGEATIRPAVEAVLDNFPPR